MTKFVNINEWAEHKSDTNETLKKKGHELIGEEAYKDFDEMVDNNSESWRGIEYIDSVLSYCQTMRDESLTIEERLRKAYDQFQAEGHSGRTAHMTLSAIRRFCFEGHRLAYEIEVFKYDPNGSLSERRAYEERMKPIWERERKIREDLMKHRMIDFLPVFKNGSPDTVVYAYSTNDGMFCVELPYRYDLDECLQIVQHVGRKLGMCYGLFNDVPMFSFDTEDSFFRRQHNGMTQEYYAEFMDALSGDHYDGEKAYQILRERTWKHLGKK